MTCDHRRLLHLALAWITALALLASPIVHGGNASYPAKAVRIILASAPGSSPDAFTRALADKLSTRLGQRFVVENKPGAGTTLGAAAVLGAKPDGYVLLATSSPAFSVGPLLYKSAQYDPLTSFTPIAMFARGSPFLIVHPSLPAKTLEEFVALAKMKPGALSIANGGVGGALHLPAELFARAAGVQLLHVPYKSEALALPDLVGGQVSAMFGYPAMAISQIRAGRARALGYAGTERSRALPDVPLISESGYPHFNFSGSMLLLGPAGVANDVVTLLNREIDAILRLPEVRALFETMDAEPFSGSPEEAAAWIKRQAETNGALVRGLGISFDK